MRDVLVKFRVSKSMHGSRLVVNLGSSRTISAHDHERSPEELILAWLLVIVGHI